MKNIKCSTSDVLHGDITLRNLCNDINSNVTSHAGLNAISKEELNKSEYGSKIEMRQVLLTLYEHPYNEKRQNISCSGQTSFMCLSS